MNISQEIYINKVLFAKLNVSQFALTYQFAKPTVYELLAKLNVCQIYHVAIW